MSDVDEILDALRQSVDRLPSLVAPMSDAQIEARAYPSEWTIADVLSHLGSGAVIGEERLACGLRDEAIADDFAPSVWDEWNAKPPRAKVDDGLAADRAGYELLAAASADERARFRFSMGPMQLDFPAFVQLRLNEHTVHTWDVEVVGDEAAVLPAAETALVVDNLALLARFTGKSVPDGRALTVRTTEPPRGFTITTGPDAVALATSDAVDADLSADLTMPAEALIRLVYGRLDPAHTPAFDGATTVLDQLRTVFPGP